MDTQLLRDLADELDESDVDTRDDASVTLVIDSTDELDTRFDYEVIDSAAGLNQVKVYLH